MGCKIKYIDNFTIYECQECGGKLHVLVGEDPPVECLYCTGKATSEKTAIDNLTDFLVENRKCPPGEYLRPECAAYSIARMINGKRQLKN